MRTLETERLILRDWKETDLNDIFICLSNPRVTIPEGSSPCESIEDCKCVLDYLILVKNNYAIELKENASVIGGIGLNEDTKGNPNARNLGFYLAEEYWNKGIMTQALTTVIANAKEVTEVLSASHNNNPKTDHILTNLGFKQVDVIKNVKRKVDVEYHDEPYYILEL